MFRMGRLNSGQNFLKQDKQDPLILLKDKLYMENTIIRVSKH